MQMNDIRKQLHRQLLVEPEDLQLCGMIQQPTLLPLTGTKLDQLAVQMSFSFMLLWSRFRYHSN